MIDSQKLVNAVQKVIQNELPDQGYLDFVAQYLLQSHPVWRDVDPFAPILPADYIDVRVPRAVIERAILRPGFQVVLCLPGSGVASLISRLKKDWRSTLVEGGGVNSGGDQPPSKKKLLLADLPLYRFQFPKSSCGGENNWGCAAFTGRAVEGQDCPLMRNLIGTIFDAYWEQFLRQPASNRELIARLRKKPEWMHLLRDFYQGYRPGNPEILDTDYFDLMDWLTTPSHNISVVSSWSIDQVLDELVNRLIAFELDNGMGGQAKSLSEAAFSQVYLLANSKSLNDHQIHCLLRVFQYIAEREIPHLQFKLFAKSNLKDMIANLEGVSDGRIFIYTLPAWEENELKMLLAERINIFTNGESSVPVDLSVWEHYQIPEIQGFLANKLGEELVDLIVKEVRNVPEHRPASGHDAPFHLLRLMRALVLVCSNLPPGALKSENKITKEDLSNLFSEYWRQEQA